jgi:hypothetical protein
LFVWDTEDYLCYQRPERLPVWKASIDLLVFVFMATSHLSEFRRQVSTPTVPKLSIALLELSGNGDETLKVRSLSPTNRMGF